MATTLPSRSTLRVMRPRVVSEGTLRTEDLFNTFVSFLRGRMDERTLDNAIETWDGTAGSDEDQSSLLDMAREWMEDAAGPGLYFGAQEGDGACFGYWRIDDGCSCSGMYDPESRSY